MQGLKASLYTEDYNNIERIAPSGKHILLALDAFCPLASEHAKKI